MKTRIMLAALCTAAMSFTAVAQAQTTVQMGGEWFSNRGPLIDIPANGGPEFRNPMVNGLNCFLQTGCIENFRPRNGGLEAPLTLGAVAVSVMTNGAAPATFDIPVGAFSVNSAMNVFTAPVTINPLVIELSTNFQAVAPGSTGITAMSLMTPSGAPVTQILNQQTSFMASIINLTSMGAFQSVGTTTIMGAVAQPRQLRADAWMTQTGRLSGDFSFCRGPVTGFGDPR